MNKSKIEWLDGGYSINPVKGWCPNPDCPLGEDCYARSLYRRFKWNPEIRFVKEKILMPTEPSKIFVGSTMELFGDWIKPEWLKSIFGAVKCHSEHTFIFLTKKPENLARWSPFPRNCWIGVSVCNDEMFDRAMMEFHTGDIQASVQFISFEPLLSEISKNHYLPLRLKDTVNWIILGGRSVAHKFYPPEPWIQEIEDAADKAGIPVFEKQNLRKTWAKPPRREWPK